MKIVKLMMPNFFSQNKSILRHIEPFLALYSNLRITQMGVFNRTLPNIGDYSLFSFIYSHLNGKDDRPKFHSGWSAESTLPLILIEKYKFLLEFLISKILEINILLKSATVS